MLDLFYTDHFVLPLPEGHRFPIGKYRLLREELARDNRFRFHPAPAARPETAALAHDAESAQCGCRHALDHALITAESARDPAVLTRLAAVAGRVLNR